MCLGNQTCKLCPYYPSSDQSPNEAWDGVFKSEKLAHGIPLLIYKSKQFQRADVHNVRRATSEEALLRCFYFLYTVLDNTVFCSESSSRKISAD